MPTVIYRRDLDHEVAALTGAAMIFVVIAPFLLAAKVLDAWVKAWPSIWWGMKVAAVATAYAAVWSALQIQRGWAAVRDRG